VSERKTCQIQWVDNHGNPTPDTRPAIGNCYREAYVSANHGAFPQTERFAICAEHAKRLASLEHWIFEPFVF
jgi:hypothetical protein